MQNHMRAQWVCSREWRIVLYKRSSINTIYFYPHTHAVQKGSLETKHSESYHSRGRAHCKILRKYCIFGYRTHFGHIATSPLWYAKWLNTDSASYGSLVAAASLDTRSICKLRVISAVAPHSSPALQVQSRAESDLGDEINAQAAIILVCMANLLKVSTFLCTDRLSF